MGLHKPALPLHSQGGIVPLDRLDAEPVRTGIAMWRALRRGARFPEQASLTSCLTPAIRDHSFLVEVLEGGADFGCRDVGTALVKGFEADFSGRRLSEIAAAAPKFGVGLRMLCDMARASGEPLGYRGWVGEDLPEAAFVHHENVLLPLGEGEAVDHLLIVSALVMRHAAIA
jgi:hypothetical protein